MCELLVLCQGAGANHRYKNLSNRMRLMPRFTCEKTPGAAAVATIITIIIIIIIIMIMIIIVGG